jgi:hypothetical protein
MRVPPMAVTRIVNLVEEPQSTFDISASTTSPVHTAPSPFIRTQNVWSKSIDGCVSLSYTDSAP